MPFIKGASFGFKVLCSASDLFARKEIDLLFPPIIRKDSMGLVGEIYFLIKRMKLGYEELMRMPSDDRTLFFNSEWPEYQKELKEYEEMKRQNAQNKRTR